MDPPKSNNGTSDDALSTSPGASSLRSRTSSESSEKQAKFILPGFAGSPPKIITIDEVANVLKDVQKTEIIHEIALNPDFKLQPYDPPQDSLEKRIKEIMHKAFWDVLREQLNRNPPCYDHALTLLAEIKEYFQDIIPAYNQRVLEHINEVLDIDLIKQQAENGVLNFRTYANFIIEFLTKSCAPIRDEQVKKLSEIDDVVETFKGILEVMSLMKLDMTNFLIEFAKKDLIANSVEYEKQKFKEFLKYYKFGFPATESWLKRNQTNNANGIKCTPEEAIINAYLELLDWNESNQFPELLHIDKERLLKLSNCALRLSLCASIMAVASGVPVILERADVQNSLAKEISILLENVTNEKQVDEIIENIWLHLRTAIVKLLEENQKTLDSAVEDSIKTQVLQIKNKDSPVRKLMWNRLKTYCNLILRTKSGLPPPPPGYTDFKNELESFVTTFRRVVTYNYAVFHDYYIKLINGTANDTTTETSNSTAETSAISPNNNE